MIGWSKPSSANVFKMNSKGVFDRSQKYVVVGCVMRNNRGHWVRGNADMMGLLVSLAAELWSIFYGLKIAWEKGDVKSVFIESDSKKAVNQVNNPDPQFWLADLVVMINNLKNEAWDSFVVVHVDQSCNTSTTIRANSMINAAFGGLIELPVAFVSLHSILAVDMM